MAPDNRQIEVQQMSGRDPESARGATLQEQGAATDAVDLNLTQPLLFSDEELRRIMDFIPQTIVILNPDGKDASFPDVEARAIGHALTATGRNSS